MDGQPLDNVKSTGRHLMLGSKAGCTSGNILSSESKTGLTEISLEAFNLPHIKRKEMDKPNKKRREPC
ncbi:hypothetical protein ACTXT7_012609 [Hymenolepis weldensis]